MKKLILLFVLLPFAAYAQADLDEWSLHKLFVQCENHYAAKMIDIPARAARGKKTEPGFIEARPAKKVEVEDHDNYLQGWEKCMDVRKERDARYKKRADDLAAKQKNEEQSAKDALGNLK